MTFCGRPSQNCLRCRQRRIKCDRARPGCSQCKRAGKECAGYRDENSLVFRSENERIVRQVEATRSRTRGKEQASSSSDENISPSDQNTKSLILSKPMPITPLDVDNHGLLFFTHSFGSAPWFDGSYPSHRGIPLFKELEVDAPFRNSVTSIGLAALSNVNRDPALLSQARQRYGRSLQAVRRIFDNISHHNARSLVRMILTLGIFEMVDAKPGIVSSGRTHLPGVYAVMKRFPFLKGRNPNGEGELYFYFSVIVHYFEAGGPFPTELKSWSCQRTALFNYENWPAFELVDIFVHFISLCATPVHHGAGGKKILREAVDLETQLGNWIEALPEDWSFAVREAADVPGTLYGQYHVYQNLWASRVLNYYRLGRLLVNELILAYIAKLETLGCGWDEQKMRSLGVVNQMATDICVGIASQGLSISAGSQLNGSQGRTLLRGLFMTMFPLTVAAGATGVSDALRCWAINMLETIGNRLGIRQALLAIQRIQAATANEIQLVAFQWPVLEGICR
ncbi:Zn(II)2Cys6 transcription factor domain-containing protein [Aspergillus lucknowensis]|uniref:Zn(2)-C6 fungal-type domain-containing protein n=1 Tax=Aspergillus lucknowensis TaxID=176173 RepID=A0ABR4LVZ8_9EURO